MANKQETKSKQEETSSNQVDISDKQELDSLIEALSGDLTAIDSDAALELIDEWYGSLNKAKEPGIKEIAASLKNLKQLLKGNKATGHEIGEVLIEIGEQTSDIASDAPQDFKTTLNKLGKQLSKVGVSLGKAEDREHIEHIDSLIEQLEDDFTSVKPDVAVSAIDEWYKLLHKSDSENFQEIANGLKELKQLLGRKTAKGSDIAAVLTKLGQQTTEAASEAKRGFKGPIQKLGKLLSKAGKSFE
ncbi:MAG: hypothetical protein ACHBN1_31850 [Heteroscytonema crispum UTEX LB 1556]